jgi:micrococcal nuclease
MYGFDDETSHSATNAGTNLIRFMGFAYAGPHLAPTLAKNRGHRVADGQSIHRSRMPWDRLYLATVLVLALAGGSHADAQSKVQQVIQGVPRVLDGDTIVVSGLHVRLNGIDAEEVSNPPEPNGAAALAGMQSIVGIGAPVRCLLNGDRSHERHIGTCFNMRGQDIAAELIRLGLALDCARYSGGRYRFLEPAGARIRLRQKPYCGR